MSGIAGIVRFDGAPVEPGLVEKMTAAMNYRGPDGISHWVKSSVALGQCMLHTTPESLEETQPLTNEDQSLVLVMDGRVDNGDALRRELLSRGAVLRSRADAELVLRAYEAWGQECLTHIDGDFALVIWDAGRGQVFCARDHLGNKPLHYHWNGSTLSFASELQAILQLPWVPQVPNEGMLVEFLVAEWYSRDETFWKGILRMPAAHRMIVNSRRAKPQQYWEPDCWDLPPFSTDEEYIERYRELLTDNVRRLSRSHRPLAVEVSGGLDSSAVFCLAEHLHRGGRLPAPGIFGYTLAFSDNSPADEIRYARIVGEFLGRPVEEIPPSAPPLSWYEDRAHGYREFPGFPNGTMSIGALNVAAARGSRVVLTGQGGDSWVQGSREYYAEAIAQGHWATVRDRFRIDSGIYGTRPAATWLLRYGVYPLLPFALREGLRQLVRRVRGTAVRDAYWLSPQMKQIFVEHRNRLRPHADQPVQRVSQRDLLQNLYDPFTVQAMEFLEREGARSGLEIRHPFNTRDFVQFAFSTPARLRLRGDRTKYIHVRALQGLLPPAILDRTTKAEFSVTLDRQLKQMKELLTRELPNKRTGWLEAAGMARLYKAYAKSPQAGWPLWVLWGIFGSDKVLERH